MENSTVFAKQKSQIAMDNSKNKLWQEAQEKLKTDLNPQHYATWIKPLKLIDIKNETIIIEVPNRFVLDWVKNNYANIIQNVLSDLSSVSYRLELKVNGSAREAFSQKSETNDIVTSKKNNTLNSVTENNTNITLNRKYSFSEFVSGSSNQFAYAAAMAVANNPASTYNPLYIYGGVGLGKTHLISAIGNEIANNNKLNKICYYTSEKFTNELINSLRYSKMDEFRNKFRNMDVLLIDDIQFIAGKERTQAEFFHTFNTLYESHKQIVLTSDTFPKDMPGLEDRLRSRFEWGLIADIQPPDIETKLAILKLKAEQNGIILPEDVAFFLASSVSSNVRELEGYLIRVGAYASLTSTTMTLDMTKEVLKDIIADKNKEITIEEIIKVTCSYYNIKVSEIKSSKRVKTVVLPRQIAMYLSRQLTNSSYPEIGEKFGGKDHSTIIHAIKKIEKIIETDFNLKNIIQNLKSVLEKTS